MTEPTTQTFGQKAVGLSFNPSGNKEVEHCKLLFASLIDQMDDLRSQLTDVANGIQGPSREQCRLASIAITEMQGAQMWAVKALTWRD